MNAEVEDLHLGGGDVFLVVFGTDDVSNLATKGEEVAGERSEGVLGLDLLCADLGQ